MYITTLSHDIPIDIVYTWVDGSDPVWMKEKQLWSTGKTEDIRFKNIDELRYSIRSVDKYMPWVNKIYIVTSDLQTPTFLDFNNNKLVHIKHSDIFENKNDLPTFNSNAIEANIHKIPGLSRLFLYFNDDCFLGSSISMSDLCDKGRIIYNPNPYVHYGKIDDYIKNDPTNDYYKIIDNTKTMILNEFSDITFNIPWHQAKLNDKTLCDVLNKKYKKEYDKVSQSRFRTSNDFSPIDFSYTYGLCSHRYVHAKYIYSMYARFDRLNTDIVALFLKELVNTKPKFFCLNNIKHDSPSIIDIKHTLNTLFHLPSRFETIRQISSDLPQNIYDF